MTRYHIAKNGQSAVCKAQSEATCPLGGKHFTSRDEADYYIELITPQESNTQLAPAGSAPVNPFDALTDAEIARRLVLTKATYVDSDWNGGANREELTARMEAGGFKSPDVTWRDDYLSGAWDARPSSYITAPSYLERTRHLKSPAPRTNAPAADPNFGPFFQEEYKYKLDNAVTELNKMANAGPWGGVAPERRIKDKAAAVRHFRDQWGPRFAQVESREELEDVLSELQISRTRLDASKWQEAGWDEGTDLAVGYAESFLRTRTSV